MSVILWDGNNTDDRKMLGVFDTQEQADDFLKQGDKSHVRPTRPHTPRSKARTPSARHKHFNFYA